MTDETSSINRNIRMIDWAGNILFEGDFEDPKVAQVLSANKCPCADGCEECEGTGYSSEFSVEWCDDENAPYDNVYEMIDY